MFHSSNLCKHTLYLHVSLEISVSNVWSQKLFGCCLLFEPYKPSMFDWVWLHAGKQSMRRVEKKKEHFEPSTMLKPAFDLSAA